MSTAKKWLLRLFLPGLIALVTMGLWLPPIISHAVEKDYHFPEVDIDATVLPNGDLVLEEIRTFDFQNGPFTYAYFNVDDPLARVRDFSMAEWLDDGTEVPVMPDYASHSIVTEASSRDGATRPRTRPGPGYSGTAWRAPWMCTRTRPTCTGGSSAPAGTGRPSTR